MNIVADESVEKEIIATLRSQGFSVFSIRESSPGATDEEVLKMARETGTALLTPDKDFGTLVYHKKLFSSGVVLYRLADIGNDEKCRIISQALREYVKDLQNNFCVISSSEIRIRKL